MSNDSYYRHSVSMSLTQLNACEDDGSESGLPSAIDFDAADFEGSLKDDLGMDLEMPFGTDLVSSLMLAGMEDQEEIRAVDQSHDSVDTSNLIDMGTTIRTTKSTRGRPKRSLDRDSLRDIEQQPPEKKTYNMRTTRSTVGANQAANSKETPLTESSPEIKDNSKSTPTSRRKKQAKQEVISSSKEESESDQEAEVTVKNKKTKQTIQSKKQTGRKTAKTKAKAPSKKLNQKKQAEEIEDDDELDEDTDEDNNVEDKPKKKQSKQEVVSSNKEESESDEEVEVTTKKKNSKSSVQPKKQTGRKSAKTKVKAPAKKANQKKQTKEIECESDEDEDSDEDNNDEDKPKKKVSRQKSSTKRKVVSLKRNVAKQSVVGRKKKNASYDEDSDKSDDDDDDEYAEDEQTFDTEKQDTDVDEDESNEVEVTPAKKGKRKAANRLSKGKKPAGKQKVKAKVTSKKGKIKPAGKSKDVKSSSESDEDEDEESSDMSEEGVTSSSEEDITVKKRVTKQAVKKALVKSTGVSKGSKKSNNRAVVDSEESSDDIPLKKITTNLLDSSAARNPKKKTVKKVVVDDTGSGEEQSDAEDGTVHEASMDVTQKVVHVHREPILSSLGMNSNVNCLAANADDDYGVCSSTGLNDSQTLRRSSGRAKKQNHFLDAGTDTPMTVIENSTNTGALKISLKIPKEHALRTGSMDSAIESKTAENIASSAADMNECLTDDDLVRSPTFKDKLVIDIASGDKESDDSDSELSFTGEEREKRKSKMVESCRDPKSTKEEPNTIKPSSSRGKPREIYNDLGETTAKLDALNGKSTEKNTSEKQLDSKGKATKDGEVSKYKSDKQSKSGTGDKEDASRADQAKNDKVKQTKATETTSSKENCRGPSCQKFAKPGSVYCSDTCIHRHADESLQLLEKEWLKGQAGKAKVEPRVSGERIVVFERKSGQLVTGPAAPLDITLHSWLLKHPTFEVLQPSQQIGTAKKDKKFEKKPAIKEIPPRDMAPKDFPLRKELTKTQELLPATFRSDQTYGNKQSSDNSGVQEVAPSGRNDEFPPKTTYKPPDRAPSGPDPARISIRNSLRETLLQRANESDDVMVSAAEVKRLALSVEEELFAYYGEVDTKYKHKYRTLITHLKDPKNRGLFRKVLYGEITAYRLARLSSDALGSRELAKWQELEPKRATILASPEKPPETMKTFKKPLLDTPQIAPYNDMGYDYMSTMILDTTQQHGRHFFDVNCQICTGKIPDPMYDEELNKPSASAAVATYSSARADDRQEETHAVPATILDLSRDPRRIKSVTDSSPVQTGLSKAANAKQVTTIVVPPPPSYPLLSPDIMHNSLLDSSPIQTSPAPKPAPFWKGCIYAQEIAKVSVSGYIASGTLNAVKEEVTDTIVITGRLPPENVYTYLNQIKTCPTSNREVSIIRLQSINSDGPYTQLYSYLSMRNRCGVVSSWGNNIRDMYILPLPAQSLIPPALLPFDGPGLPADRSNCLLGIIVVHKQKPVAVNKTVAPPVKTWMYAERTDNAESTDQNWKTKTSATPVDLGSIESPETQDVEEYTPSFPTLNSRALPSDVQTESYDAQELDSTGPSDNDEPEQSMSDVLKNDPIVSKYSKSDIPNKASEQKHSVIDEDDDDTPYDPFADDDSSASIEDNLTAILAKTLPSTLSVTSSIATVSNVTGGTSVVNVNSINLAQLVDQLTRTGSSPETTATLLSTLVATSPDAGPEEQKQILQKLTDALRERQRLIDQMNQTAAGACSTAVAASNSSGTAAVANQFGTSLTQWGKTQPPAEMAPLPISMQLQQANDAVNVAITAMSSGKDIRTSVSSLYTNIPSNTHAAASTAVQQIRSNVATSNAAVAPQVAMPQSTVPSSSSEMPASMPCNLSVLPLAVQQMLSGRSFENLKSIIATVNKQTNESEHSKSGLLENKTTMPVSSMTASVSSVRSISNASDVLTGFENAHGDVDYRVRTLPIDGNAMFRPTFSQSVKDPKVYSGRMSESINAPGALKSLPLLPTPAMPEDKEIIQYRTSGKSIVDLAQSSTIPLLKPPPLPPSLTLSSNTASAGVPAVRPPLLPPPLPSMFGLLSVGGHSSLTEAERPNVTSFMASRPSSNESGNRASPVSDQSRVYKSSSINVPVTSDVKSNTKALLMTPGKDVSSDGSITNSVSLIDIPLPSTTAHSEKDRYSIQARNQVNTNERKPLLPTPDPHIEFKKIDSQERNKESEGQKYDRQRLNRSPYDRDSYSRDQNRRNVDRSVDPKDSSRRKTNLRIDDHERNKRFSERHSDKDSSRRHENKSLLPGNSRKHSDRFTSRNESNHRHNNRSDDERPSRHKPVEPYSRSANIGSCKDTEQTANRNIENNMQNESVPSTDMKEATVAADDVHTKKPADSLVSKSPKLDGSDQDHAIVVETLKDESSVDRNQKMIEVEKTKSSSDEKPSLLQSPDVIEVQHSDSETPDNKSLRARESKARSSTRCRSRSSRSRSSGVRSAKEQDRRRRRSRSRSSRREMSQDSASRRHPPSSSQSRSLGGKSSSSSLDKNRRSPGRSRRSSPDRKQTGFRREDERRPAFGERGCKFTSTESNESSTRNPLLKLPSFSADTHRNMDNLTAMPMTEAQLQRRQLLRAPHTLGLLPRPPLMENPCSDGDQWNFRMEEQPIREFQRTTIDYGHGSLEMIPKSQIIEEYRESTSDKQSMLSRAKELDSHNVGAAMPTRDSVNRHYDSSNERAAEKSRPVVIDHDHENILNEEMGLPNVNRRYDQQQLDDRDRERRFFDPDANSDERRHGQSRMDKRDPNNRTNADFDILPQDRQRDMHSRSDDHNGERRFLLEKSSPRENWQHRVKLDKFESEQVRQSVKDFQQHDQRIEKLNVGDFDRQKSAGLQNSSNISPSVNYAVSKEPALSQLSERSVPDSSLSVARHESSDRLQSMRDKLDDRRAGEGDSERKVHTSADNLAKKRPLLGEYPGFSKNPHIPPSVKIPSLMDESPQKRLFPDQDTSTTAVSTVERKSLSGSLTSTAPNLTARESIPKNDATVTSEVDKESRRLMAPPRLNEQSTGVRLLAPADKNLKIISQLEKQLQSDLTDLRRPPFLQSVESKRWPEPSGLHPVRLMPPDSRPLFRPLPSHVPGPHAELSRGPPSLLRRLGPGNRPVLAAPPQGRPMLPFAPPHQRGILGARPLMGPPRHQRPPSLHHHIPGSIPPSQIRPMSQPGTIRPVGNDLQSKGSPNTQ